jgi:5-oxoprolinase (ATP-hydrolysing)
VLFYTASRGHHTDVGGLTPGSMPPDSRTIHDEGAYIDNWTLVARGRFREAETRDLLLSAKYPVRSPEINLADLRAQVAANEKGVQELRRMVAHFGLDVVEAYMAHVQDNAEESVRRAIEVLADATCVYRMDPDIDGREREVRVAITVDRAARSATIDFTGTTGALASNYNAPEPVTRAAVLYVFRCLVDDNIPMNEGRDEAAERRAPEGHHAVAGIPRRGDRRQRRDEPGGDLRALPRPRGAGRGAVHHEQHHLGRREPTSITRRSAAAPGPAGSRTARAIPAPRACIPT